MGHPSSLIGASAGWVVQTGGWRFLLGASRQHSEEEEALCKGTAEFQKDISFPEQNMDADRLKVTHVNKAVDVDQTTGAERQLFLASWSASDPNCFLIFFFLAATEPFLSQHA